MAIATSALTVTPLHPDFGAEVSGVDLTRPLDDATFARLDTAFTEYSVLVFHDQRFPGDAEQMAFSERFGPLEATIKSIGKEDRLDPRLVNLDNLDADGRLMGWDDRRMLYQSGNQLWHSDSSFKPVPAHASLLSARVIPPEGGDTEFVSLRAAYDALPAGLKARVEGKIAVHSILYSRSTIAPGLFEPEQEQLVPAVRHPLVRTNPVNGRRSLYIGSHAWFIEGMPYAEGRALLDELLALATRPERVYQHRWAPWDLVMWDNRCTLHRGRPWDAARYPRVMRRTTVAGAGPTADPPFADPATLPSL